MKLKLISFINKKKFLTGFEYFKSSDLRQMEKKAGTANSMDLFSVTYYVRTLHIYVYIFIYYRLYSYSQPHCDIFVKGLVAKTFTQLKSILVLCAVFIKKTKSQK